MNLIKAIEHAKGLISPFILETPFELSRTLSQKYHAHIHIKAEHLQKTGSFKLRGALNKILSLEDGVKQKGVVAASTGNHGLGVALAAEAANTKATIFVPEQASESKIAMLKLFPVEIIQVKGDCLVAEVQARQTAEETGRTFISPYNDLEVIAGQGTIGLEIADQCLGLDAIFISVGGGGLISGVASYLKECAPNLKIIACSPENSAVMKKCLEANQIIDVEENATLADAISGNIEPGSITFDICKEVIDSHVLVSEDEIKQAIRLVAETEKYIIEGAAGVAMAACLKEIEHYRNRNVGVILCGRNIAFDAFRACL